MRTPISILLDRTAVRTIHRAARCVKVRPGARIARRERGGPGWPPGARPAPAGVALAGSRLAPLVHFRGVGYADVTFRITCTDATRAAGPRGLARVHRVGAHERVERARAPHRARRRRRRRLPADAGARPRGAGLRRRAHG